MEQQIQELVATIQQLRDTQNALNTSNQELRAAQANLAAENQVLREGQAGIQVLAKSVGDLAQQLKKDPKEKKILMDTKGLGKPETFDNKEDSFRRWIRSINNLIAGVFGNDFDKVLEECLDSEDPVVVQDLDNKYPLVENIPEVGEQIYRVLCHLCTGESEDLVVGASNGYEAYRKLCRRWDPATSGRKRNLLRAILNPERCKTWAAVRPAIEQLEDLVRRYEARKSASGTRETLSDDIKSASLELLVPTDLEKHLILNKNRLTSYERNRKLNWLLNQVLGQKVQ